jgi:methyl-accepting chemotaxis protein
MLKGALALTIADEPEIAGLIESNAREALIARYAGSQSRVNERSGLGLITFSRDGVVVGRVHAPAKFGDDIRGRRKMIVATLADKQLHAGVEPGRTSVNVFATAPVMRDSELVGIVDVDSELSADYFSRIAEKTDSHIAIHIFADGTFETQSSTFDGATMMSSEDLKAVFDGNHPLMMVSANKRDYAVNGKVLKNFSGEKIGVIEMAVDVTPVVAAGQSATSTSIIATVIVSLLSLLGFFLYARSFSGIIRRMTETWRGSPMVIWTRRYRIRTAPTKSAPWRGRCRSSSNQDSTRSVLKPRPKLREPVQRRRATATAKPRGSGRRKWSRPPQVWPKA